MGDCSPDFKVKLPNLMQPVERSPLARKAWAELSLVILFSLIFTHPHFNGIDQNGISFFYVLNNYIFSISNSYVYRIGNDIFSILLFKADRPYIVHMKLTFPNEVVCN